MQKKIYIFGIIGLLIVGYIVLQKNSSVATSDTTSNTTKNSSLQKYTLADITSHNNTNDCWMVINGSVYNVTSFIASGKHNPEILRGCGLDASTMFAEERKHSGREAQSLLKELIIGTIQ